MRSLLLTLLTVVFIVLVVILIGKGQERIAAENAGAGTEETEVAGAATSADPAGTTALEAPAATSAAPAEGAAAPSASLPGREPFSVPTPKAKEKSEPKPAFQILARPAIAAPGVLETTRGRVTLAGVMPLEPLAVCGKAGNAWPCGQMAVTQLRRFLRGRSVNCDIADAYWEGEVTARCTIGSEDLAAWLVENGWARAAQGSAYEAVGRKAEADRRGIFGADPRTP